MISRSNQPSKVAIEASQSSSRRSKFLPSIRSFALRFYLLSSFFSSHHQIHSVSSYRRHSSKSIQFSSRLVQSSHSSPIIFLDFLPFPSPHQTNTIALKIAFSKQQGSYVGVHSTGFRDFLLKPELLRAISDLGFEHPSEGESSLFWSIIAPFSLKSIQRWPSYSFHLLLLHLYQSNKNVFHNPF